MSKEDGWYAATLKLIGNPLNLVNLVAAQVNQRVKNVGSKQPQAPQVGLQVLDVAIE